MQRVAPKVEGWFFKVGKLKEYRLQINGNAVEVFDGPSKRPYVLSLARKAYVGRVYTLEDPVNGPLVELRKAKNGSAPTNGGAVLWASRFQTQYRIELFGGSSVSMRIPLFTERPAITTSTGQDLKVRVHRKNLWQIFMTPGPDVTLILAALGVVCSERWRSSYGTALWAAAPKPVQSE